MYLILPKENGKRNNVIQTSCLEINNLGPQGRVNELFFIKRVCFDNFRFN